MRANRRSIFQITFQNNFCVSVGVKGVSPLFQLLPQGGGVIQFPVVDKDTVSASHGLVPVFWVNDCQPPMS
jgi:hypothetical protein